MSFKAAFVGIVDGMCVVNITFSSGVKKWKVKKKLNDFSTLQDFKDWIKNQIQFIKDNESPGIINDAVGSVWTESDLGITEE